MVKSVNFFMLVTSKFGSTVAKTYGINIQHAAGAGQGGTICTDTCIVYLCFERGESQLMYINGRQQKSVFPSKILVYHHDCLTSH